MLAHPLDGLKGHVFPDAELIELEDDLKLGIEAG
jgi:hypothetical protein